MYQLLFNYYPAICVYFEKSKYIYNKVNKLIENFK